MFDPVCLDDLSFKSTFAQNESCRSSFHLQLLFWSNSKFLYEIWSFSWSNSSQNHSNEETVDLLCSTRCSSPAIPATVAVGASSTRRPSTIFSRRADASLSVRDAHPPFLLPFLLPRACAEPGRARAAAELCAGRSSPPCPVSSRQSLLHLTPQLRRSIWCSI